jgi:hypothetical protein
MADRSEWTEPVQGTEAHRNRGTGVAQGETEVASRGLCCFRCERAESNGIDAHHGVVFRGFGGVHSTAW